jgi:cytoskeletal protein RodZ
MARLGKSKSPLSTLLMVVAVIALLGGIAYLLFAPSNVPTTETPSGDITVGQTATPSSEDSGTSSNNEATGDSALTPLPEATATPRPGAPVTGITPAPSSTAPSRTAPSRTAPSSTPDSSSIVTNATPKAEAAPAKTSVAPEPEATGVVPVPEITAVPEIRLTPVPNATAAS